VAVVAAATRSSDPDCLSRAFDSPGRSQGTRRHQPPDGVTSSRGGHEAVAGRGQKGGPPARDRNRSFTDFDPVEVDEDHGASLTGRLLAVVICSTSSERRLSIRGHEVSLSTDALIRARGEVEHGSSHRLRTSDGASHDAARVSERAQAQRAHPLGAGSRRRLRSGEAKPYFDVVDRFIGK